ncbi:MAG: chromosome partitioning protein ParB [Bacteroidetes bacterium CG02_land_8_20_14_3_00_31_25]|nr:ParB/RepB/Spo0J family partition protein [Bacteroidota bacterium]PIV58381.1 MAG: chromosome partitioning protein ParB [Bacteroidetes bacterium CG02_land_8_20_14_3_00_31_25]PIY04146.1 MAG: chromosome partitioning protein ParB [Bacteroidetes bacterium CG_4_10_14_3_um_filter_31_20]
MSTKKSVLGRGLEALIEDANTQRNEFSGVNKISVVVIENNPFQPRTNFNEDSLNELAESIKALGIIQPITVRKIDDNKYQLISGERRLRAAKIAGLKDVPAFIRDADDNGMLEMSLVENIQREDLDPIEIAISYNRLIEECELTQEELSERVGKQRTTITNFLRLLKLPPEIQLGLRQQKISVGHARALINVDDAETQIMLYHQILRYDFSVRKVEDIVRELSIANNKQISKRTKLTSELKQLRDKLIKQYNCKVDIKKLSDGKGKITLSVKSEDDFNNLINKLFNK